MRKPFMRFVPCYESDDGMEQICFDEEYKQRLLTVLKRGSNTLSPPDLEIINLIREMEK